VYICIYIYVYIYIYIYKIEYVCISRSICEFAAGSRCNIVSGAKIPYTIINLYHYCIIRSYLSILFILLLMLFNILYIYKYLFIAGSRCDIVSGARIQEVEAAVLSNTGVSPV
jgi:hypothetical protein